ncbi:MAG: FAD-dependent monooxygenase [Pseudomonadota bacterium]
MRESDIIIAGAGLSGLAAAAFIADAAPRMTISVIDLQGSPPAPDDAYCGQRVSALTPTSVARFESLGVWDHVSTAHAKPFSSMRVWDAATACGEGVSFNAAQLDKKTLGVIVDNIALRHHLYGHIAENDNVTFVAGAIQSVTADARSIRVMLDDGAMHDASLLIGADGRGSSVRKHCGLAIKAWSHDQVAVVTQLMPDISHEDCALQRFMPTGPLALLPLSGGRVSLVWSTTPVDANALLAMDDEAFSVAVTEASDEVLGTLRCLMPRVSFPLSSQYAKDPVSERAVLIGDAAHAIHPLAGQGINLGFSDAAALAKIIGDLGDGDPGDAPWLRRYRRRRTADNLGTLYGLDLLNRLFAREQGLLADTRRRGMRLFDSSLLAKRLAGGHAMGDALGIMASREGVS